MFERFTERARQVVVLAQDEARVLKHNYIGSEHVLLGLLREENGIAARALASLGITVDEARAQVIRIVGRGAEDSPVSFRSRRAPSRRWSAPCARRCRSATATSEPSTSCSAS